MFLFGRWELLIGAGSKRCSASRDASAPCDVHWESDVIERRFLGAATQARLHADPTFMTDLEAAKAELATARAKNLSPQRDCKYEASVLKSDDVFNPHENQLSGRRNQVTAMPRHALSFAELMRNP